MDLHFTAVLNLVGILIEDLSDIYFFFAAGVLVIRSHWTGEGHLDLWGLLVHMTIAHFRDVIEVVASLTPEYL